MDKVNMDDTKMIQKYLCTNVSSAAMNNCFQTNLCYKIFILSTYCHQTIQSIAVSYSELF